MSKIDVTFPSAGIPLAGHLHLPDAPAAGPRPAIVVGHPGTGVKEQAAGLYARHLAERGFVALAYDAAYQGESGGEPRNLEDPAQRVEDLKAAVSFLTTRGEADPGRIGMLGICASGGYALSAVAGDRRVKAVATVSAADVARQFRLGADGTQDPAVYLGMLDAAAHARTVAAGGEEAPVLDLFPETVEQARALGGEHGAEGFEYYRTERGRHPRSPGLLTWDSVDRLASFDAFAPVPLIGQRPLLMVVGTRAVTSWMSVEAFQRATGPKELHWIEGASHVDLYDRKQYVDPAVERIAAFFGEHLGRTA
ncbi:alpha/beta hydrolase [Nonomuraea gerenzanensis]|uniref:Dienelactone hydrolase and related enzymes n=1 Tax=Nonomuraea gerenzanensis TaxID=93944 RepID=A0A1M4EEI7_9ACTN|nr:alpha/beta hydrolase [Nonomuraea gerenzanensis]UBU08921.1 alpha/beta hydrolase [Nonomuraea gerenzanensis]SBO97299.1 Dienelactone hydrolase and related enzymes [Nonomuraea gerenzanensis]